MQAIIDAAPSTTFLPFKYFSKTELVKISRVAIKNHKTVPTIALFDGMPELFSARFVKQPLAPLFPMLGSLRNSEGVAFCKAELHGQVVLHCYGLAASGGRKPGWHFAHRLYSIAVQIAMKAPNHFDVTNATIRVDHKRNINHPGNSGFTRIHCVHGMRIQVF